MRILLLVLLMFHLSSALSEPRQLLVPGGVAIIDLEPGDASTYSFRGKPVLVTQIAGNPSALVGLPLTATLRLAVGILFLAAAPQCRLPYLVLAIGVLEIAGVAVLLVLGAERLRRFAEWWTTRPPRFIRCWCTAAFSFGALLAYAGLPT